MADICTPLADTQVAAGSCVTASAHLSAVERASKFEVYQFGTASFSGMRWSYATSVHTEWH